MKRSAWVTVIILLQLFYVLVLLALPVYLLALTRAAETVNGPDAAENISGLQIGAAVLAGPALVGLAAWFGLWKGKRWGWAVTILTDLAFAGVFVYSLIDDGWKNVDWAVVALTAIAVVPVVYLLSPPVRRTYWPKSAAQLPATSELR
jgi:hypothetical protein